MKQQIICQLGGSLKSVEKWYGVRAADLIFEITDIIHPYLEEYRIHTNYEVYLAKQIETNGIESDRRILSNLLPDCPVFYPLRQEGNYPYIENGFLKDIEVPGDLLSQAHFLLPWWEMLSKNGLNIRLAPCTKEQVPVTISQQEVICTNALRPKYIHRLFGGDAVGMAYRIDILTLDYTGKQKWNINLYKPYVIRQFDDSGALYYEGTALTNLLPGMPVFYPLFSKPFPVNETGGFHNIRLPKQLVTQINALNYRGVDAR